MSVTKMERDWQGGKTAIRLIRHFRLEHVGELKKSSSGIADPSLFWTRKEVTIV